jgi:ketosteroid isomerase-like protein
MDRSEIERLVRSAYTVRIGGKVDEIVSLFDPDAHFELVGDGTMSPVPLRVRGADDLRVRMAELVRTFTFNSHQILTMVIDGSKAAVRGRVNMTCAITGQTVETELADFFEIRDGRIVSLVEFCDTALIKAVVAK